ncbi:secondary thiamine-phosphate synthase enzyme YjbQ [Palleronia caenipelagi]|uniref:YjbQ family protein n=1 Tax=Palleronia caenipelagi TaxID=2489174 RepID=A0A547Q5D7_9RHOB|nr:secondary thiamine-phosphate synthase enzyme YjbQ [Palleronia caenipelagi]TRD21602.1 YjbQ family protein [Palleronia caenipelagi]
MDGALEFSTRGNGLYDITARVAAVLPEDTGVLTLFVQHTSCSLLIQENADPDAQRDLMAWIERLVPRADHPDMAYLRHRSEGPDDMPAHIKAAHLPVSLSIPVQHGRMRLGTWQGIYLWEHRDDPHFRRIAWSLR